MMQQDDSTSEAEADNHIKPKPVKVKAKNGRGQDQSTPAKKPRHSEIKKNNRKWTCAICKIGFNFWNELDGHVTSVHKEMNENESESCEKSYSGKGNLGKHVSIKHKPKKSLIQYECMHCRRTEDNFNAAVYHAQVHLVEEFLIKKNGTQIKLEFAKRETNVSNSSLMRITFDYKTLLRDAWFDMFQNLSTQLKIEAPSLYKHTRCVKLNWDSGSKQQGQGRCVLLYQCDMCKLIVDPAKVENHCDYNGDCAEGGQGYKCKECPISFYTSKALKRHHKKSHENKHLMVKIATFNNKDDVTFNNILKQILRSSVDDTHEDTKLEGISRNPGTPENEVSDKRDVQVAKEQSHFDFEAHNAYHENKKNEIKETFLGQKQPSCSVKAGTNIASPGENVSNASNTRKDILKNRSKVQAHKDYTVEASKDNYSDRIENGSKSGVTVWDSNDDSNDSDRQSPAQLNLSAKSFGGVFTKKDKIIQKNSNDNINTVKNINHDNVAKGGMIHRKDQKNLSAFKCRRISGEDNNPGEMLEADNKSESTKDQRALEDDVESVNTNEDFDQRGRELQESTRTTANIGAVNKPISVESGVLESSQYVSLNGNMAILHGSFHQDDLKFNSSRGKQCTAIAAVACAAFCELDPNTWTKTIIDRIIVVGDKYYKKCIVNRTLPAAGEVNPEYLAVTELMPTIDYDKFRVSIAFEEARNVNGHIDNDNGNSFPNLKNGLKFFFRSHASGILTSNAMSVAVYFKSVEGTYWLFDSHSRGPEGEPALGGAACCMRFSNLDDLHDLLRRNLFVSSSRSKEYDLIHSVNVYSLTALKC